jgi:maleylacetoacetate isomerase
MKLYTFWRSQAAFRVRIALNLKGLTREDIVINLDRGDQFKPEYKAQNPQAVVPTLYDGNAKLFQSVAILEYLEEKYPNPPILPKDLLARAWVRGFALINAADSHPLDRTAHPQLSGQRAEGRRGWPHRVDPALAQQRIAGDGGVASGEKSDRQVL